MARGVSHPLEAKRKGVRGLERGNQKGGADVRGLMGEWAGAEGACYQLSESDETIGSACTNN